MVYVSFSLSLRGEHYSIKTNLVLNNAEKRQNDERWLNSCKF